MQSLAQVIQNSTSIPLTLGHIFIMALTEWADVNGADLKSLQCWLSVSVEGSFIVLINSSQWVIAA